MVLEVILEDEVKEAVKHTYIKLRKGKKEAFDRVEIDDAPISSTGVFHVKFRHLDAFMGYHVSKYSKVKKSRDIKENYASLLGLDLREVKAYYSCWKEVADQINKLGEYSKEIFSKLKDACGEMNIRKRVRKFKMLMDICPSDDYKNKILEFARLYQSFLEFESDNAFVKTINDTIRDTLVDILKDPFEVYYDGEKEDFVFCSDKYDVELVLVLKTGKDGRKNAELFTAYSQGYEEIRGLRKEKWERIYTRKKGCLIKN